MSAKIKNTWCLEPFHRKAKTETSFIFSPENGWMYSHHPSITYFKNRFCVIWSNGRVNEDDTGQRILISFSADGISWEEPRVLIGSTQGSHSELVLTAAGFHQHEGRLTAYSGKYEYCKDSLENGVRKGASRTHQDTDLWAVTTEDGENWSRPVSLGLPIVPNHGPQKTANGRLVISGNISFPWTDDPSGLSGWAMSGIYPREIQSQVCDDSDGFWNVKEVMQWSEGLCEGSFYQTYDNVLHMLLRSGTAYLWCTESTDNGVSWSYPCPTGFSDNGSKFHFGRLPDGRFYYVGNPQIENHGSRTPLVLSLSEDGLLFDRHWILGEDVYQKKQDGLHKTGQYGYPHSLVHDGFLYVVFSRMKEAVQVVRVPIESLAE